MNTTKVINAVRNPHTNLAKLAAAAEVSVRTLMAIRHDPHAKPNLRTLEAIEKALAKGAS